MILVLALGHFSAQTRAVYSLLVAIARTIRSEHMAYVGTLIVGGFLAMLDADADLSVTSLGFASWRC